jgi:hypothetical protein
MQAHHKGGTMKDVEISYKGKTLIVTLKRLSWGAKNRINDEAADITINKGGDPSVKMKTSVLSELTVARSIVKVVDKATNLPDNLTLLDLRSDDFTEEAGNALWNACQELAPADVKKNN